METMKSFQNLKFLSAKDYEEEEMANLKMIQACNKFMAKLAKLSVKNIARKGAVWQSDREKFTKAIDNVHNEGENYRNELKSFEEFIKAHRESKIFKRNIRFVQDQDRSASRFNAMKGNFKDTLNLSQLGISSENFDEIEGSLDARGDEGSKKLQGVVDQIEVAMQENRDIKTTPADEEIETEFNYKKEQLAIVGSIELKDIEAVEKLAKESRNEITRLKEKKLEKGKTSLPFASPMPFFTQAFADRRSNRNNETSSNPGAKSTDMPQ